MTCTYDMQLGSHDMQLDHMTCSWDHMTCSWDHMITYSNVKQSPDGFVIAGAAVGHGNGEHRTPPQQGVL